MIIKRLLIPLLIVCTAAVPGQAQDAQKGQQIAQRAEAAGNGYGDFTVQGNMTLRTAAGATSERRFAAKNLELNAGRATRYMMVFEWPGDIRGTALLTHSFDNKQDSQWLYLPAAGRVKKISGNGRSGSFVGSEFSYEDMVEQDASSYKHVWLRDEPCPNGAGTCHLLRRIPTYSSGYSQQAVWIDTSALRYQLIQYYNRQGKLNKTLTMAGYNKYKGRFWRPSRMTMVNHLTGKSTVLNWKNYRFNVGLQPSQLTREAMTRAQ